MILTIVDRFSKTVYFVPMPKLPRAKETAEAVLQHVVHLHGFPVDVVSDRGPRFISQFWRAFCSLVGASVSLSSGFQFQVQIFSLKVDEIQIEILQISWKMN